MDDDAALVEDLVPMLLSNTVFDSFVLLFILLFHLVLLLFLLFLFLLDLADLQQEGEQVVLHNKRKFIIDLEEVVRAFVIVTVVALEIVHA